MRVRTPVRPLTRRIYSQRMAKMASDWLDKLLKRTRELERVATGREDNFERAQFNELINTYKKVIEYELQVRERVKAIMRKPSFSK